MTSQLQLPVEDIKDLAITTLLVAAHIAMGGETTISIIELAIDLAARFAVESGLIEDVKDLEKLLGSIKKALTSSKIKAVDDINFKMGSREMFIEVKNCTFKGLCGCVMMRWDVYKQMFGKRPCPVASFVKYVIEHQIGKKMDIVSVECESGNANLKLIEL